MRNVIVALLVRWWVLGFCLVLLSGCAYVVNGKTQKVGISSTPSAATVWINNDSHITPAIISLDRNSQYTLIFRQNGYTPASATLNRNLSPWLFGNLFLVPPLGTIVGLAIDVHTGALWNLSPEQVNVVLWKVQR
jgi:uncharacterized protein YceK